MKDTPPFDVLRQLPKQRDSRTVRTFLGVDGLVEVGRWQQLTYRRFGRRPPIIVVYAIPLTSGEPGRTIDQMLQAIADEYFRTAAEIGAELRTLNPDGILTHRPERATVFVLGEDGSVRQLVLDENTVWRLLARRTQRASAALEAGWELPKSDSEIEGLVLPAVAPGSEFLSSGRLTIPAATQLVGSHRSRTTYQTDTEAAGPLLWELDEHCGPGGTITAIVHLDEAVYRLPPEQREPARREVIRRLFTMYGVVDTAVLERLPDGEDGELEQWSLALSAMWEWEASRQRQVANEEGDPIRASRMESRWMQQMREVDARQRSIRTFRVQPSSLDQIIREVACIRWVTLGRPVFPANPAVDASSAGVDFS